MSYKIKLKLQSYIKENGFKFNEDELNRTLLIFYIPPEDRELIISSLMRIKYVGKLAMKGLNSLTDFELQSIMQDKEFYQKYQKEFDAQLKLRSSLESIEARMQYFTIA